MKGSTEPRCFCPVRPEMEPMFSNQVVPYLKEKTHSTLVSHSIHIFGLGESYVESCLHDFMEESRNPTLAPYAKEGEVLCG